MTKVYNNEKLIKKGIPPVYFLLTGLLLLSPLIVSFLSQNFGGFFIVSIIILLTVFCGFLIWLISFLLWLIIETGIKLIKNINKEEVATNE